LFLVRVVLLWPHHGRLAAFGAFDFLADEGGILNAECSVALGTLEAYGRHGESSGMGNSHAGAAWGQL
jgi:hypothetical protein